MSYRVTDDGAFSEAVVAAGNRVYGAVVRVGSWCCQQLTDGRFSRAMATVIDSDPKTWERAVEVGLVAEVDGGYYVVGYLDHNPPGSVVRARRIATKERSLVTPALKSQVLKEKGYMCGICGGQINGHGDLHFDHIVPVSKGGKTTFDNLQPAHADCNIRKGAN